MMDIRSLTFIVTLALKSLHDVTAEADNSRNIRVEDLMEDQPLTYQQQVYQFHQTQHIVQEGLSQIDPAIIEQLSVYNPRDIVRAAATANISNECSNALLFILETPTNGLDFNAWNLKFFDSWGKISDGILTGHFKWPGMYDECKNISVIPPANSTYLKDRLDTKYCTMSIPVIPKVITFQFGMCSPKQCSAADLSSLWNDVVGPLKLYGGAVCQEDTYELSTGRIIALVFVCILIGISVLATLVDGVHQFMFSWQTPSAEESERRPLLGGPTAAPKLRSTPEHGMPMKLLLSFSMYSNSIKLLDTHQGPTAITCLNGIRFFSMTWVILGHTLMFLQFAEMNNPVLITELLGRFSSQALLQAPFSVDSFFVLSGLLVGYLFMRDFKKRQIQVQDFFKALPLMYLHRYLRLTPAYGIMILIYTVLMWFTWDGPSWPNPTKGHRQTLDTQCVDIWYQNLLYVNNLFNVSRNCAPWGWYLANDTQFFLVAPFLVYIFYISAPIGLGVTIASIIGSIIAALVVSDQQRSTFGLVGTAGHYNFTPVNPRDIKLPLYSVPWTRFQSYGVGILAGLIIWKIKDINFKLPKMTNLLFSLGMWGVAIALCMSVVYGPYSADKGWHIISLGEAVLYNGLSRAVWSVGLSILIILCVTGNGGWINQFLSWSGFVVLSRLTYCAYLIHIPILVVFALGARNGKYFNNVELAKEAVLIFTLAYMCAFFFSLLFEQPFINLDKLLLAPHSLKRERHTAHNGTDNSEHRQQYQSVESSTGRQQYHSAATAGFTPISPDNNTGVVNGYGESGHSVGQPNNGEDLPPKYQELA